MLHPLLESSRMLLVTGECIHVPKNCLKILIETISVSQESPSFFTHVGILRVSKLKTPVVTWKNYLFQWITNKSCNHATFFNVAEDKESMRRKNEHLNFIEGHFLLCIPECIAACEEKHQKMLEH